MQKLLSQQQSSAELPFLKPLLGSSGRSLTFQPLWCESSVLSPGVRALFTVEPRFSQTQTQGYSELFSLCMQGYVLAQNAPALHRILAAQK